MRLATRKRPVPLLRVIRRARELVPQEVGLHVEVLGEGPARATVERFVSEHAMDGWVSLPGRVTRDELKVRYAAADIYVSPGELESFGIAALEARTAGLPVIARQGSGVGEFVTDGVNGYLARDDDAMATALARLASDAPLRASMTSHNLDHRPAQDWASVAARAEAEYRRAIGSRARR